MSNRREPGTGFYFGLAVGLVAIVILEVILTFLHLPVHTLLFLLLCLAAIEALIGVLYLMHVKYERRILFWTVIPATLFVLVLLDYMWPDAYRMAHMSLFK